MMSSHIFYTPRFDRNLECLACRRSLTHMLLRALLALSAYQYLLLNPVKAARGTSLAFHHDHVEALIDRCRIEETAVDQFLQ